MNDPRPAAAPRVHVAVPDPLVGRLINERYQVQALIARGGMGKVYRAEQAPLGRLVALKVLNASYVGESDPEFHKRFFLEASIASKLTHPNTVTIHDFGSTDDDVLYIAMELLEGRTLHRALREEGPFGVDRTLHVARQVCRALREAHGHGVIHRDLKPANVFLVQHGDEKDFVKVLDFGLVKNLADTEQLTQTGLFMGSPKYMSPEQIRGGKVDPRVDVYALGVMLYEMLTGRVPFDDANSVNILMAHVNEQVPYMSDVNPNVVVPQSMEAVVRKCMAKRPEDRFASMEDVLTALRDCAERVASITAEHALLPAMASMPTANDRAPVDGSPTATRTGPLFVQASRPSGSGAPLFLAALFALTGIGGFIALGNPFDAESAPAPQEQGAQVGGQSGQAQDVSDRSVLVSLRSTPPGATVLVGDQEYGPTPTQIEWSGEAAAYGRVVKFTFRRQGYQDVTVIRQIRGDRLDVHAPPMELVHSGRRPSRVDFRGAGPLAPDSPDAIESDDELTP